MKLLVCLEGPLLAEELVRLMDAVADIAPESIVEMPEDPTAFAVGKGDAYVHVEWSDDQRRVSPQRGGSGAQTEGSDT